MGDDNENGKENRPKNISQLILTFNREKFQLVPSGSVENYDEALAILEMAHRHFEGLLRASQVKTVLSGIAAPPFRLHGQRQQ